MSIKYILTAYHSARDRAGNCYWAFQYRDIATGRCVQGTVSGGESNIAAIRLELNGGQWPAPEVVPLEHSGAAYS